jgi:hypothetical protein
VTPSALSARLQDRGHHLPAAGAAVLAVVLIVVLPEPLGQGGRLAAVLVAQLALVVAWVLATGIEGFLGQLAIGAGAAGAADLVIMLPAAPDLGGLLGVLGVGFVASVLQQMLRRPRPDVVGSLAGGVLLLCAVCALAVLLLEGRSVLGPAVSTTGVLAAGAALAVGHLVDLVLPRPQVAEGVPRGAAGLLVAVLVGAAVAFARRGAALGNGGVLPQGGAILLYGAVLGAVAALTGLAASYLVVDGRLDASAGSARSWALPVVQAVLPLAACAPVALAVQTVL